MDGISIAASIVGLLSAAATISLTLTDFITRVKEAPKLVNAVLLEISDISACLGQVQSLLLGAGRVNASNQSLLMVDQVVVVLSNCVLIFSELEKLVEGLKPDQSIPATHVLKWALREKAVAGLLSRLQSSKTSLSLMISTLTYSSIEDVQSSVGQLTDLVRQVLESNQDMFERLGRMESKNSDCVSTTARTTRNAVVEEVIEDSESTITVRQLDAGPSPRKASGMKVSNSRFEFERLLESSRPYMRASKRPDPPLSATSSVIQTLGWSCLSGISLAEVSNISIIELALDKQHIWNPKYYDTKPRYLSTVAQGKAVRTILTTYLNGGSCRCKECGEVGQHSHVVSFPIPF